MSKNRKRSNKHNVAPASPKLKTVIKSGNQILQMKALTTFEESLKDGNHKMGRPFTHDEITALKCSIASLEHILGIKHE